MIQERLRKARKDKGVSMTYMAQQLGYKSASGYANIESGHTTLSLEKAKTIAELLDIDMDELFFKEKLHV